MDEEQIRKYARKRVHQKQGFYYHLIAFIFVNLMITVTRYLADGIHWTLIFPFLPWLIGLMMHWCVTFYGDDPFTFEKKVEKEMERYKNSR